MYNTFGIQYNYKGVINMKKFLNDFKEFAMKGNVIDMAVGVVIGGSFGKIVTGLVNYIINPFIGIFTSGSGSLDALKTVIHAAELNELGEVVTPEVAILWGTWIQTIIDFLITALCIFLFLRLIMSVKNRFEAKKIAEAKAKEEAEKAAAEAEEAEKAAAEKAERDSIVAVRESLLRQEALLQKLVEKN